MRLLNVELLVCDRCGKRFEMRLDDGEHCTGYGTVTVRNIGARPVAGKGSHLSEKEKKIVACLVDGKSNKTIARELECAEATVKVHVKNIMRKAGMKNRTQIAVLACGNGNCHPPLHITPPQAITSDIDRNADLCRQCLEDLNIFLNMGSSPLRKELTEKA